MRTGCGSRKVSWKTHNEGARRAHMCEAHIQDASDDISQSDSDVVTPEEEKSKLEKPKQKTNRNPPRKLVKKVSGVNLFITKRQAGF